MTTSHVASHALGRHGLDGYAVRDGRCVGTARSILGMDEGDMGVKNTRTL